MRSYFQSINDGTSGIKALLYIINAYNKSEYAIFRWSNFTDKVTYGQVDIEYLKDSGNDDVELTNNYNYKIQLIKHGDRGPRGYQGYAGIVTLRVTRVILEVLHLIIRLMVIFREPSSQMNRQLWELDFIVVNLVIIWVSQVHNQSICQ